MTMRPTPAQTSRSRRAGSVLCVCSPDDRRQHCRGGSSLTPGRLGASLEVVDIRWSSTTERPQPPACVGPAAGGVSRRACRAVAPGEAGRLDGVEKVLTNDVPTICPTRSPVIWRRTDTHQLEPGRRSHHWSRRSHVASASATVVGLGRVHESGRRVVGARQTGSGRGTTRTTEATNSPSDRFMASACALNVLSNSSDVGVRTRERR